MPESFEVVASSYFVESILYDSHDFSVAWGKSRGEEQHVAMRWNRAGTMESMKPPATSATPWFHVPGEVALSLMQGLLGKDSTVDENVLKVLAELLSRPLTS